MKIVECLVLLITLLMIPGEWLSDAHSIMLLYHRVNINSTTGELYVAVSLDYESQRSFIIAVIAIDNPGGGSDNRNMETGSINITVEDVNDNRPVFTESGNYTVHVYENEEQFTFNVTATDRDSGQFTIYLLSSSLSSHY